MENGSRRCRRFATLSPAGSCCADRWSWEMAFFVILPTSTPLVSFSLFLIACFAVSFYHSDSGS